jgi:hypothetical protein
MPKAVALNRLWRSSKGKRTGVAVVNKEHHSGSEPLKKSDFISKTPPINQKMGLQGIIMILN